MEFLEKPIIQYLKQFQARRVLLAFCILGFSSANAFDIEQAVRKVLPGCQLELKTSVDPEGGGLLPWFGGHCGKAEAIAFVRQELVRTHPIVILKKIVNYSKVSWHILRFEEPQKYLPSISWISSQASKFEHKEEVDALSGATMTRSAVIKAFKQIDRAEKLELKVK